MIKITLPAIRWTISFLMALVLSFLLVGFLLGQPEVPTITSRDRLVMRELRGHSNELIAVMDEFIAKRPGQDMADIAAFEHWVHRGFRPHVNDLRQRLILSDISNSAHTDLLAATDRLAALAGGPYNDRLQEVATLAVTTAASETERFIAQFGPSDLVTPLPLTPSFARR